MQINDEMKAFGFKTEGQSTHNARTMMLKELCLLFQAVNKNDASKESYFKAIIEDNCLGKNSGVTRKKSASHLANMYVLDESIPIFRSLRFFWERDKAGQPLLAFLCLYARDSIIQGVTHAILEKIEGEVVSVDFTIQLLRDFRPGAYSDNTLTSTAQNILSSFAQAGFLQGRINKRRTLVSATSGSIAFALLLGFVSGYRGENLMTCEFVKLLDCRKDKAIDLALSASRSGWLSFKHIEDVYEVSFPNKEFGVSI